VLQKRPAQSEHPGIGKVWAARQRLSQIGREADTELALGKDALDLSRQLREVAGRQPEEFTPKQRRIAFKKPGPRLPYLGTILGPNVNPRLSRLSELTPQTKRAGLNVFLKRMKLKN
jgi:hypothetical protein